ncbi:phage tail protein [Sinorhizobium sp. A49]|uniref:phage tail protein n=1 Tax=Sinorhizobium sp. A49 TaxID=1945861 RepID=UPI000984A5DD|nr:phage tail protein [Sinorhizobium sp. A49]
MGFLAPIIGGIVSAIGSIGIVGKMVIAVGLNLIVSKMEQRRAKKNQKQVGGVEFERQYGENVSRQVACGLVGLAGHDTYVNTYGASNKYLEQAYTVADFPCDGLSRIWAGGALLSLEEILPSILHAKSYRIASGAYAGRMVFTFYDGTQTAADADMVANANPPGRWTADHIGTGIAWIKVGLTYDSEHLSQFPDFFFEIRGARLYDIRKDSTAGGSGPHRWGVYSTYEFTENPILFEYNYRRGFSVNDDMFCGMGMDPVDLPFDRYATAANICDEGTDHGKRYRCSVMLDADVDHGDNIEAVMRACGGIVIDSVEGSWPLVGTDQPIVETFTDDDLVVGEPVRYQRRRSMADLVNIVSGTYPEPANMWSPAGYDVQTNPAYVALDRRTRDVPLDFPTVPYKAQANQLASIYFNENRYEATADIVLRPRFQTIKAGDWVRWNSARYGDRIYMVQGRAIRALTSDGPRNVALSLQERSGAIYDGVGVIAPTVPLPPGEPVYLNELQDFAVIAVKGVGADGRSYPAFRISWAPIVDLTVTGITFEYWIKTEPANKFSKQVSAADGTVTFIQEGVLSLTDYEFRYKLAAARPTNWIAPITVKSLDGGNADLEIGLGRLGEDVKNRFEELQGEFSGVWQRLEELTAAFSLDGAVGEIKRQELKAAVGNAFAQIVIEQRVRASQDEALAQLYTALTATVGSNLARLITEETARATADEALSSRIVSLDSKVGTNLARLVTEESTRATADSALTSITQGISADMNNRFAGGLVKFEAAADQSGVNARFSVMLRANLGDAFKDSGFYIEIYTEAAVLKSRFAVKADQFVVWNGGNNAFLPIVIENGELKLNIANIGLVRSGRLLAQNGKMDINLNLGTIEIYS